MPSEKNTPATEHDNEALLRENETLRVKVQELEAVRTRLKSELEHSRENLRAVVVERRNTARRLEDRDWFVQALLKALPIPVFYKDNDGRYIGCNRAFEEFTGLESAKIKGKRVTDIVDSELAQVYHQRDMDLIKKGGVQIYEGQAPDRSGRLKEVLFSKAVFLHANGDVHGLVGAFMDVTERRMARDALVKAKEAAENADRAKSEFLALMSHDIRTPLNALLGCVSLLREYSPTEQQRPMLDIIENSGNKLLSLINDILDLSKIEAGHIELAQVSFNPAHLAEEVLGMFTIEASKHNLQLKLDLADSLPNTVYGDPDRIDQILTNLIGNAVKFTKNGSITLHVAVESAWGYPLADEVPETATPMRFTFSVEDTGRGVPDDLRETIFEPFQSADREKKRSGTGLGLAICRNLARLMGGDVTCEPRTEGTGSVFVATLVLASQPETDFVDTKEREPLPNPSGKAFAENYPIEMLVVDDVEDNAEILARLLEFLGYKPRIATSGAEALELYEKHHYQMVMMDVRMPGMDGVETARRLRKLEETNNLPPCFLSAVTADVMQGDRERCLSAGMDDYLTKPVSFSHLQDCLKRAAEKATR